MLAVYQGYTSAFGFVLECEPAMAGWQFRSCPRALISGDRCESVEMSNVNELPRLRAGSDDRPRLLHAGHEVESYVDRRTGLRDAVFGDRYWVCCFLCWWGGTTGLLFSSEHFCAARLVMSANVSLWHKKLQLPEVGAR